MATIDGDLRLVLPLRSDADGNVLVWGYHTPISTEVFRANYRTLAATKAAIFGEGVRYAFDVGAQIAALRLRDEGKRDAEQRGEAGDSGVQKLMEEFQRLTMAAVPGASGWETVPVNVAFQRNLIDQDDWMEVESAIVFFSCAWFLTPRHGRSRSADILASQARGSMTRLSLMEWAASLPTSTPIAATPAAAA